MKCGCIAQGEVVRHPNYPKGTPSCVIHDCHELADTKPNLAGRKARCYCYKVVDSSYDLPFFHIRNDHEYDEFYCGHDGWN